MAKLSASWRTSASRISNTASNSCRDDDGSASFIIKVAQALASLDFAPAIRDLQGFRVEGWSDMTESVKNLHEALR